MKTVITLEIDDNQLTISEEGCTGETFTISNDMPAMARDIADHLTDYLLYERDAHANLTDYYAFVEDHKKDVVSLDNMVGEHILRGVAYGNNDDGFQTLVLYLDDQNYLVTCDPDDGYRSMLGAFFKTERKCPYSLPDIHVRIEPRVIRHPISAYEREDFQGYSVVIDDPRYESVELIRLGTDYSEDYYPCCIMWYKPEVIKAV